MVKCYINGKDAATQYGAYLSETSLCNLIAPPPNKEYLSNKSANAHGKTTYIDASECPALMDERDITLVFVIKGANQTQMLTRYKSFCNVLKQGKVKLTTDLENGVAYNLNYISCTQCQSFFNHCAKFTIKFNEPNPNNRV